MFFLQQLCNKFIKLSQNKPLTYIQNGYNTIVERKEFSLKIANRPFSYNYQPNQHHTPVRDRGGVVFYHLLSDDSAEDVLSAGCTGCVLFTFISKSAGTAMSPCRVYSRTNRIPSFSGRNFSVTFIIS